MNITLKTIRFYDMLERASGIPIWSLNGIPLRTLKSMSVNLFGGINQLTYEWMILNISKKNGISVSILHTFPIETNEDIFRNLFGE